MQFNSTINYFGGHPEFAGLATLVPSLQHSRSLVRKYRIRIQAVVLAILTEFLLLRFISRRSKYLGFIASNNWQAENKASVSQEHHRYTKQIDELICTLSGPNTSFKEAMAAAFLILTRGLYNFTYSYLIHYNLCN